MCSVCGCTSSQFLETGFLGCSECYKNLSEVIEPVIFRMFGLNEHTSSFSKNFFDDEPRLSELQEKLKKAVIEENYEYASLLKKEIDCIKQGGE